MKIRRAAVSLGIAAMALTAPTDAAQRIRLSASRGELEAAVKKDSNDAASHYNMALVYWNDRRWADVERSLNTAVAIEHRFAAAHLARYYLVIARLDDLRDSVRKTGDTTLVTRMLDEATRSARLASMFDPFVDHKLAAAIPRPKAGYGRRAVSIAWLLGLSDFGQGVVALSEGRYQQAFDRFDRLVREYHERGSDSVPLGVLEFRGRAAVKLDRFGHAH
jgi:hypothetical protein